MYAAYITLKDQNKLSFGSGGGCDIHSIDNDGLPIPFNPKYPVLRIKYNENGSFVHPSYKEVDINLSDIWLIGESYESGRHLYEDNVGVNHPNARKALEKKGV